MDNQQNDTNEDICQRKSDDLVEEMASLFKKYAEKMSVEKVCTEIITSMSIILYKHLQDDVGAKQTIESAVSTGKLCYDVLRAKDDFDEEVTSHNSVSWEQ